MGWKSKFAKGAKAVGRGAKEVGKFTAETTIPAAVGVVLDQHGDKIGNVAEHVETIAGKLEGGIVTQEQADRIEAKLDGQTAQLAEIRHLLQRSLDIQLGKEGARDG